MHNIIALHTIRNIGWIIVCCPDVRSIILRLAEVLDSLNIGLIVRLFGVCTSVPLSTDTLDHNILPRFEKSLRKPIRNYSNAYSKKL